MDQTCKEIKLNIMSRYNNVILTSCKDLINYIFNKINALLSYFMYTRIKHDTVKTLFWVNSNYFVTIFQKDETNNQVKVRIHLQVTCILLLLLFYIRINATVNRVHYRFYLSFTLIMLFQIVNKWYRLKYICGTMYILRTNKDLEWINRYSSNLLLCLNNIP